MRRNNPFLVAEHMKQKLAPWDLQAFQMGEKIELTELVPDHVNIKSFQR